MHESRKTQGADAQADADAEAEAEAQEGAVLIDDNALLQIYQSGYGHSHLTGLQAVYAAAYAAAQAVESVSEPEPQSEDAALFRFPYKIEHT